MSIDKQISLQVIRQQIDECSSSIAKFGWVFSAIDEDHQSFRVSMTDYKQSVYHLEIVFNDFPEIPLWIDFVDPDNGEKGTKRLYPKGNDSFFHQRLCICNPCSRNSYKEFRPGAPHGDWKLIGWQNNPKTGELKNLNAILKAIYVRINNTEKYTGKRMA